MFKIDRNNNGSIENIYRRCSGIIKLERGGNEVERVTKFQSIGHPCRNAERAWRGERKAEMSGSGEMLIKAKLAKLHQ